MSKAMVFGTREAAAKLRVSYMTFKKAAWAAGYEFNKGRAGNAWTFAQLKEIDAFVNPKARVTA